MTPKTAYKALRKSYDQLWESVSRDPYLVLKLYLDNLIPQDRIDLAMKSMCQNGEVAVHILGNCKEEYREQLIKAIAPDPVLAYRTTKTRALTPKEHETLRAAIYVEWTVGEMVALLFEMVSIFDEADPELAPVVLDRLLAAQLDDKTILTLVKIACQRFLGHTPAQARLIEWLINTPDAAQHTPSHLPVLALNDEQISRLIDSICSSITTAKCAWHYGLLWFTQEQRERVRRATYTPYEWAMLIE